MYPIPFDDARRAMRMIRARAKQLNIDTSRIGVIGFSAGGHLASTLTVHFDTGDKAALDSIDRLSCRPAFAVLIYPVISMKATITHTGSRTSLLGSNPDTNLVNFLSNDLQVTQSTPPSFLVHTKDDNVVKFQNSQLFYDACVKNKVVAKFKQFERGPHGFGLADGINGAQNLPELAVWPDTCAKWLDANGFFSASTSTVAGLSRSRGKRSSISLVHGRMVAGSDKSGLSLQRDFSGRALKVNLLKN
jgi:acetyl esterase/lipase